MASVTGFTAERMLEMENDTIISGTVNAEGRLILFKKDGTTVDAGYVVGPQGAAASIDDVTGLRDALDSKMDDSQLDSLVTEAEFQSKADSRINAVIPTNKRVNFAPSGFTSTSRPVDYPDGITVFHTDGKFGTTWPVDYGVVVTIKRYDSRIVQRITGYQGETWERAGSSSLVWHPWQCLTDVIVLPDPVAVSGVSVNQIFATSWSNLPAGDVAVTMNFPVPTWVQVFYGAWMAKVAGNDVRCGVDISGGASSAPSDPYWGSVLWSAADQLGDVQMSASKVVKVAAGSTTFRMKAYVSSGEGRVHYPIMEVVPLRVAKA